MKLIYSPASWQPLIVGDVFGLNQLKFLYFMKYLAS